MTFEEMQRTMQFIVEQQAKFEGDISLINETASKNNEAIIGLVQISRTLINSQIAAEGRMAKIEEKMVELVAAEKRTDERLDAFIDFFERYISSRNGGEQTQ